MSEEDIKALNTLPDGLLEEMTSAALMQPASVVRFLLTEIAKLKIERDALREQLAGVERFGITSAGRAAKEGTE